MKLHQPPTPACAPNIQNLTPKHPGTTGARGPSSGTSDVRFFASPLTNSLSQKPLLAVSSCDSISSLPFPLANSPAQDRNPAASKCSPLVRRFRLLEKASRLQEGRMGSVVTGESRRLPSRSSRSLPLRCCAEARCSQGGLFRRRRRRRPRWSWNGW
ncbi:hypothetical protein FB45DRAFT_893677 [Roridomyces roridus]|uniref:Uncharacterized protein n=1 Tax=Roridomyces roridus TaxID=1738132 RepID=A0AAD7CFL4_9AGAR|nr:hypothetical protein FB45DRAFT_893677 [Roridomyces roridus]